MALRVFAYCTYPARGAVAKATGVTPETSLPLTAATFRPEWLGGRDLIYFRLHALDSLAGLWFGEDLDGRFVPALRQETVERADLDAAVVVVANCYGTDDPMIPLLYTAGAGAVIAAPGANFAHGHKVIGADLLIKWLIGGLRLRLPIRAALRLARMRLRLTSGRVADKDALGFQVIEA